MSTPAPNVVRSISPIACMLLMPVLAETVRAEITVIPQPDEEYLESTTKIDLSDIPDRQDLDDVVDRITDGTLTVVFDRPLYKATVGASWVSWSSPPYSESETPAILVNEDLSLTLDLSVPVTAFGFELEPFVEGPFGFRVEFVFRNGPNGPETVGAIDLDVSGLTCELGGACIGGARLFAATNEDASGTGLPRLLPFDRIVITGGDYFAIAQIRYDKEVEEVEVEIDIMPGSDDNPVKVSSNGRIPVAILTTSDVGGTFDATTVDPDSVCFGDADDPRQRGDCTEAHGTGHIEDVDGDGDLDMLLHFNIRETGIEIGDEQACLTGTTLSGVFFSACDVVAPR